MSADDGADGGRWWRLARITLDMVEGADPSPASSSADRDRVRAALARDRFAAPRAALDLPGPTEAEAAAAFSLFTRLVEFGSVDQAAVRFATLQGVYGLGRAALFAHLIAGRLRAAAQRRPTDLAASSLLLYRLPHVLHVLVLGQHHPSLAADPAPDAAVRRLLRPARDAAATAAGRYDLLCALRDVSRFPDLVQAEIPSAVPTTTWFGAFVDVLAQLGLVSVPDRDQDPVTDAVAEMEEGSGAVFRDDNDLIADGVLNWCASPQRFAEAGARTDSVATEPVLASSPPSEWRSPRPLLRLSALSVADLSLPDIALPLPSDTVLLPSPNVADHTVPCSTSADVRALVRAVLARGGADCAADLIPALLDLALAQPAWFGRAQRAVCAGLVPVLARAEFGLERPALHACLGRLAAPAALQIVAVHEQLGAFLAAVLALWNRLAYQPLGPQDDPKLQSELLARAQFVLLYAISELGQTGPPELLEFRTVVLCTQPLSSGHDENKEISTALLSVSSRTHPEASTYGDAMRLTALQYAPINVLRAVRFALLPSINQQSPDPERYYNFLRVLIVSLPFVSTVVIEFLALSLQADLALNKPLSGHVMTWSRVFAAVQRFPCPLSLHLYRPRLAQILAGAGPAAESEFGSLLGPGHLSSMIRHTDHRQLLLKHGRYLARSHQTNLAAAWKEIDLHMPVIRYCLGRAAGLYEFLETLLSGLREPEHGNRISELAMFETCAALLSMCGERIVPRNLRYDKYPLVSFLTLVLSDRLAAEYDAVWAAVVTEAGVRKSPDVFAPIAALLVCWPGPVPAAAALRWAHIQSGRGDAAVALLALSPSDPEQRAAARELVLGYEAALCADDPDAVDVARVGATYRAVLAGL